MKHYIYLGRLGSQDRNELGQILPPNTSMLLFTMTCFDQLELIKERRSN